METNSSFFNTTLHMSNTSYAFFCLTDPVGIDIFSSFTVATLLLLPLSIFILVLGFRRWKQRRPSSHLDHFTYHMAAMEVLPVCGSVVYCAAAYYETNVLMKLSFSLLAPTSAKVHFNSLTCVERYLAVVHPITYLGLKKRGGVMIRNICISCLWLLSLFWAGLVFLSDVAQVTMLFFSLAAAFIIISFCSVAVLCVLIRPGPAKVGDHKEKLDQSKKRAFRTVVIILGVLLFGAIGTLVCDVLSLTLNEMDGCALMNSAAWFSLPSSLVLPLLFLHRLGKWSCCEGKAKPAA